MFEWVRKQSRWNGEELLAHLPNVTLWVLPTRLGGWSWGVSFKNGTNSGYADTEQEAQSKAEDMANDVLAGRK
jgi:hypothetical protein